MIYKLKIADIALCKYASYECMLIDNMDIDSLYVFTYSNNTC